MEGKTYKVRAAITPESVTDVVVEGVYRVELDLNALRLLGDIPTPGVDRPVLAVFSAGTWADCVQVPQ